MRNLRFVHDESLAELSANAESVATSHPVFVTGTLAKLPLKIFSLKLSAFSWHWFPVLTWTSVNPAETTFAPRDLIIHS